MALIAMCWHWLRPVPLPSAWAGHDVRPVQPPAPVAARVRTGKVCAGLPAPPAALAFLSPAPAVA